MWCKHHGRNNVNGILLPEDVFMFNIVRRPAIFQEGDECEIRELLLYEPCSSHILLRVYLVQVNDVPNYIKLTCATWIYW